MRLSRSALDRLGKRLATGASEEDLRLLFEVEGVYAIALATVVDRVQVVLPTVPGHDRWRIQLTRRVKTVGTLLDKLRRGTRLSRVQDVAGCRLYGRFGITEQDEIVGALTSAFAEAEVKDRRQQPNHGYRAVHVVVASDELPVEIQVRTAHQHAWANATEELADIWGRGIRYGQPPEGPDPATTTARSEALVAWLAVSDRLWDIELAQDEAQRRLGPRVARASATGTADGDLPAVARALLQTDPDLIGPIHAAATAYRRALEACPVELRQLMRRVWEKTAAELGEPWPGS